MRTTFKRINAYLAGQFPGEGLELVRGNGYFYVIGPALGWESSSLYFSHLSALSNQEWVDVIAEMRKQAISEGRHRVNGKIVEE